MISVLIDVIEIIEVEIISLARGHGNAVPLRLGICGNVARIPMIQGRGAYCGPGARASGQRLRSPGSVRWIDYRNQAGGCEASVEGSQGDRGRAAYDKAGQAATVAEALFHLHNGWVRTRNAIHFIERVRRSEDSLQSIIRRAGIEGVGSAIEGRARGADRAVRIELDGDVRGAIFPGDAEIICLVRRDVEIGRSGIGNRIPAPEAVSARINDVRRRPGAG
jgi:hypothetical protein